MEDAIARRERLKALQQAARLTDNQDGNEQPDSAPTSTAPAAAEPEKPALRFRNYAVQDKRIQHEKVAPAQPPKLEEPTPTTRPEDGNQEELLASVAPKRANWDLKREIAPKLEKLERRTQRALVQIMQAEERRRIEEQGVQD